MPVVKDLTDFSRLPAVVTAPFLGKAAAQGVAKYLLEKVYLTRAGQAQRRQILQKPILPVPNLSIINLLMV
jgi:hypothetical protein